MIIFIEIYFLIFALNNRKPEVKKRKKNTPHFTLQTSPHAQTHHSNP